MDLGREVRPRVIVAARACAARWRLRRAAALWRGGRWAIRRGTRADARGLRIPLARRAGARGGFPSLAGTRASIGIARIRSSTYPQTCPLVSGIKNFHADLRIHVEACRASLPFCLRFAAAMGGDTSRRTTPLPTAVVPAPRASALPSAATSRPRWPYTPHGRSHC
jgi:hypothetical protein